MLGDEFTAPERPHPKPRPIVRSGDGFRLEADEFRVVENFDEDAGDLVASVYDAGQRRSVH